MEKCTLCGVEKEDYDTFRTAYLNKDGSLEGGYYRPRLTIDEKFIVQRAIGGFGEFVVCTNRHQCNERRLNPPSTS